MILAILAAWFGYKKAKDTGRSGILWAFICAGTFLGVQIICGLGIGLFIGIGVEIWGWSPKLFDDYGILINIVCIAASIGSLFLVFRYLDKIPQNETVLPPPPTFEKND